MIKTLEKLKQIEIKHGMRWWQRASLDAQNLKVELKLLYRGQPEQRISALIYMCRNQMTEVPTCPVCNTTVMWHSSYSKFATYCGPQCRSKAVAPVGRVFQGVSSQALATMGYEVTEEGLSLFQSDLSSALSGSSINGVARSFGVCRKSIINSATVLGLDKQLDTARKSRSSGFELLLERLLKYHGIEDLVLNDRTLISPYEIDILIPSKKIAIEVNGLMYHSEHTGGKDRSYHINKWRSCKQLGYTLIQVWDIELLGDAKMRTINRIIAKVGASITTYARNLKVIKLDSHAANTFFEHTHTQGSVNASVTYGLVDTHQNIIAAMSFGTPRFDKRHEWELLRFASQGRVVGGASKLFKRFVVDHTPTSIISYSDNRWGAGSLYPTLGFTFETDTQPNYYYFKLNEMTALYHRAKFQKHKLDNLLQSFNSSSTEWENMKNHGFDRVWDCGSSRWVWGTAS